MEIQKIFPSVEELTKVKELVLDSFNKYIAPGYNEEGVKEFHEFINNIENLLKLDIYGAYSNENELMGIIAIRDNSHITLFFVDDKFKGKGIGRKLFDHVCKTYNEGYFTVNSSPDAKEIYEHIGFNYLDSEKIENGIRFYPMKMRYN